MKAFLLPLLLGVTSTTECTATIDSEGTSPVAGLEPLTPEMIRPTLALPVVRTGPNPFRRTQVVSEDAELSTVPNSATRAVRCCLCYRRYWSNIMHCARRVPGLPPWAKRVLGLLAAGECVICQNALSERQEEELILGRALSTPCHHRFHKHCLFRHILQQNSSAQSRASTCPLCRQLLGQQLEAHAAAWQGATDPAEGTPGDTLTDLEASVATQRASQLSECSAAVVECLKDVIGAVACVIAIPCSIAVAAVSLSLPFWGVITFFPLIMYPGPARICNCVDEFNNSTWRLPDCVGEPRDCANRLLLAGILSLVANYLCCCIKCHRDI